MSSAGKLLKHSAIYGLAPYIPTMASILILPLLTAHLTETDYGIAGTISAYVMAIAALSNLGLNVILQVSFFHSPNYYKYLWRQIYGFLQLWMVVFAIIQGVLLYFIIPEEAQGNRWLIILLSNFNTVFFGPSSYLGPLYFQLSQKPLPIAIRSLVSGFLTLIINYVTIVLLDWAYMGWYISSFMSSFFVNATYWYELNFKLNIRPIYKFHWKTIKDNLKISIPMIPHYYTYYMVTTSNRMVMDWSKIPISKIGNFNMGQQFAKYMESGIGAIEKAISPMCMESIQTNNEEDGKKLIYLFVDIVFAVAFLFAMWSKEMFSFLIRNQDLASAYPIAAILILALSYRPMYVASSNYYFYYGKTLQLLLITMVAGVIAMVANIIFIPRFGIIGASAITYCAFLYQGYSGFLFKPYKQYAKVRYPFKRILLIQVSMSMIALSLLESSLWVKGVVSSLVVSFAIHVAFRTQKES